MQKDLKINLAIFVSIIVIFLLYTSSKYQIDNPPLFLIVYVCLPIISIIAAYALTISGRAKNEQIKRQIIAEFNKGMLTLAELYDELEIIEKKQIERDGPIETITNDYTWERNCILLALATITIIIFLLTMLT